MIAGCGCGATAAGAQCLVSSVVGKVFVVRRAANWPLSLPGLARWVSSADADAHRPTGHHPALIIDCAPRPSTFSQKVAAENNECECSGAECSQEGDEAEAARGPNVRVVDAHVPPQSRRSHHEVTGLSALSVCTPGNVNACKHRESHIHRPGAPRSSDIRLAF